MRDNTPPRSPYSINEDEVDDDELIYVGDADEVLDQWMADMSGMRF